MKRSGVIKLMLCGALLIGVLHQTYAQRPPDNDSIQEAILNMESTYYYPVLFNRYLAGDTTLTLEHYRHLYYGYVWQNNYKPHATNLAQDKLLTVLEENQQPDEMAFRHIIHYANEVMETEPFNPSTINFLTYAYGSLGDTVNERINHIRFEKIIEAIKSTGTGLKEGSPWHVISFTHAHDIMVMMRIPFKKAMVVSSKVEYYPFVQRYEGIRGYYFDYSRIYWFRPDEIPKRKSGWQLNGMPIRLKD